MRFADKINQVISKIDTGAPVLKLTLNYGKTHIRPIQEEWTPVVECSPLGDLVKSNLVRNAVFISDKPGFVICNSSTINNIRSGVLSDFMTIYSDCSSSKYPARTKGYKNFKQLLSIARREDHIFDDVFDIFLYYKTVTLNFGILHANNDVHRKNILHLMDVLGSKHGRN